MTEGAGRVVCGVMNRGAGAGGTGGFIGAGGAGLAVGAAATGAAGLDSTGGRGAGGGGAVAACCFCVINFRTSPGLEMWERSILVLISSASRVERADRAGAASAVARKWARTLSASWSSSELEWVFFSVTPTSVRTSRIALLLTSSSLARSLIRILLIRPFFAPPQLLKSSSQPHGVSVARRPAAWTTSAENPDHCFGSAEVSSSPPSTASLDSLTEPGSASSAEAATSSI